MYKKYYQVLYTTSLESKAKTKVTIHILNFLIYQLSYNMIIGLWRLISIRKLNKALVDMVLDKDWRLDGLLIKFYITYWLVIKDNYFYYYSRIINNYLFFKLIKRLISPFQKITQDDLYNWCPINFWCGL